MEIYKSALKGILAEIGKLSEVWVVKFCIEGEPYEYPDVYVLVGVYSSEEEAEKVRMRGRGRYVVKCVGAELKKVLGNVYTH